MINYGGYVPDFKIKLNIVPIESGLISGQNTSIVSRGIVLDSEEFLKNETGALWGNRYNIEVVPEKFVPVGNIPTVSLVSDNSGIATIDSSNNVSCFNTGYFNVLSFSALNPNPEISSLYGELIGSQITSELIYVPENLNVSKHVLIVYNTNSTDSINLKNYYTGTRPHFNQANILGVNSSTGEFCTYSNFTNQIRKPIIDFITGNSKNIRYVVMMQDIPTTISSPETSVGYEITNSLNALSIRTGNNYRDQNSHFSLGEFQGTTCLVSYINFGSYNDSVNYIKKISQNQTGILLTGNNLNTGYYFEDSQALYPYTWVSGKYLQPLLDEFPSTKYVYRDYYSSYISTGNNLAGYATWGTNGSLPVGFPNNGTVRWGGNNNRYVIVTVESFNGRRNVNQSNYGNWFSSGAFGGTGYENCPIGAVCHVTEPFLGGVQNSGFFVLWQRGWPLIECAWQSRVTPYLLVCGDPLVCR